MAIALKPIPLSLTHTHTHTQIVWLFFYYFIIFFIKVLIASWVILGDALRVLQPGKQLWFILRDTLHVLGNNKKKTSLNLQ